MRQKRKMLSHVTSELGIRFAGALWCWSEDYPGGSQRPALMACQWEQASDLSFGDQANVPPYGELPSDRQARYIAAPLWCGEVK